MLPIYLTIQCFHLWDLDARGFHRVGLNKNSCLHHQLLNTNAFLQGLWRFWLKSNHILVVGHPYSPYSNKYKPAGITPLTLTSAHGR